MSQSATLSPTTDRPVLGIMLMLGFCVLAPMGDALAKVLGAVVPLGLLVFVRFLVQAAILIPIVVTTKRPWRLRGRLFRLMALRTLLHIAGITAMFSALQFLPLADAVAIAFVMPFIMLVLGKYILNEDVGMRRFAACVVGFIGTLLVIQPSFVQVGWPALLPVVVAFVFSFFMLVTRQLAKDTDPIGLQAVSGVLAAVLMLPVLLVGDMMEIPALSLPMPDRETLWMLFAIGALGTGAHLLMTWSLRFAPSATLAPMQYLEIPIATAIGWMVFRDLPNTMASIGICITIGAGVYVILRERANARIPTPEAPA